MDENPSPRELSDPSAIE